jgi:hypothetical protein
VASTGHRGDGASFHMIHRSKEKIQSLESNVEFSGGVLRRGFELPRIADIKARKGTVLSILIEVLEGIYDTFLDTLQARLDDLLSGAGGSFIVIF